MSWLSRIWKHYTRIGYAQQIARELNALMASHPDIARDILALADTRIPCSEQTAEHPTIQVVDIEGAPRLGLIGLLNGIIGIRADGEGYLYLGRFEDGSQRFGVMPSAIQGCPEIPRRWAARQKVGGT